MQKPLSEIVDDYELSTEITSDYAYQLRYAVRRFGLFLQRPALLSDLTADAVNRWLKHERDGSQIGDRSRANVRRSLLTLWKRFGDGLNRDSIRSVIVTPRNPEAWLYDEMELVAQAATKLPGRLTNGIKRSLYMPTLLWCAYETGLRRRDLWTFDISRFDAERRAALTQHKTKRVHVIQITPQTEEGLRQMAGILRGTADQHWRTPLRWPQSTTMFYYWMRECRKIAGVDAEVSNRSLQHVRRTGATEVCVEGGHAWRFLGHSREGLDRKSYVDQRMTSAPTTPTRNRTNGSDRRGT
jgi:integrase